MALAQSDLKRLIAYSSVSHMGFVTLGIFVFNAEGIQGAILQMFTHGVTTGALFLVVGQLYDRTHSRAIGDYGGLFRSMPRFVAFLSLFSVASFALPGTGNFIGEFLILTGVSYRSIVMVILAMAASSSRRRTCCGCCSGSRSARRAPKRPASSPTLNARETVALVPLAIMVFVIGLYPRPLLNAMDATVVALVERVETLQSD